jgi:capsid protein
VVDAPLPTAGRGEVRVRVLASGVEYTDVVIRRHLYPQTMLRRPPFVLGYDVVGAIDQLGDGVRGFQIGVGVPYTNVTGDLRQANYSSLREGKLEFRRRIEQFQHGTLVFQLCRRVWQRWIRDAVLSGALGIPGFAENPASYLAVKWIPPKWDWVDPLKDRKAEIEAIEAGLKSRSDVIESEGYDAEEVDRRIAADRAREEELGLKFGRPATAQAEPAVEADPEERERLNQAEENAA